jgi:DNA primase large subunit
MKKRLETTTTILERISWRSISKQLHNAYQATALASARQVSLYNYESREDISGLGAERCILKIYYADIVKEEQENISSNSGADFIKKFIYPNP